MAKFMATKHSIKDWVIATRPWSFPASAMPVLVTLGYLFWSGHQVDWITGILTILNVVLFHAAGNTWSDYKDYKSGVDREDTVGGLSIVSGQFKPQEIKKLSLALFAIAVAGGLAGAMFGGGNAKFATAAGGAILGGLAGNQIDKAVNNTTGERITVRLDQKRNGTRNYTIVQAANKNNPIQVGQRVRVIIGIDAHEPRELSDSAQWDLAMEELKVFGGSHIDRIDSWSK